MKQFGNWVVSDLEYVEKFGQSFYVLRDVRGKAYVELFQTSWQAERVANLLAKDDIELRQLKNTVDSMF